MKRKIGLWDLVFMNVSAIFGIRWIAKSTADSFGLGLGAIPIWVLFSFIFFVPSALICAELASTYQKDGGLYEWVKEAYGEKWGFMVSWLNWTAKIFWYSSFLTFFSVNISFALGQPHLASDKNFVLLLSLATFCILSFISTKGMTFGKFFTNIGALGSTIPSALLIVTAFISIVILKNPSSSTYTISTMMPKLNMDSMAAISSVMFALSGAEITANFITDVKDPKKNFPKAIILSAAIVASLYVLGSIAITSILSTDKITASRGILESLSAVTSTLGIGPWFIQLIAFSIGLSVIGTIIIYIASPVKMLFGSVKKGVFPEALSRVNKHNIPVHAVSLQAIIVTIILLGTNLLPSVDAIYNILITMTALTALFPYVLLFLSYSKLRKKYPNEKRPYEMIKNNKIAIAISNTVLAVTILGILLSAAPVMKTFQDNLIYEFEMIGGGLGVILAGLAIWRSFEKRIAQK